MENLLWLAPVAGVLALVFALFKAAWIGRQDAGTKRMREIADAIHEGAMAFLKREYSVLVLFVLVLLVLLAWLIDIGTAVSFLAGAIASVLAGYIGMSVATRANVRTANAAQHGI
ncbi:MAG TPA: sodium-translocating pyrophosphatase, partial [Firmicutes bacterium]|nr:sodium-translocating pyrophosphatase [Bacillota bacterium]